LTPTELAAIFSGPIPASYNPPENAGPRPLTQPRSCYILQQEWGIGKSCATLWHANCFLAFLHLLNAICDYSSEEGVFVG
jgi:hypothetical protein